MELAWKPANILYQCYLWRYELIFFFQGFDEYMNVVLDDAEEYHKKNKTRKPVGKDCKKKKKKRFFKGTGYECRRVEWKNAKLWGEMVKELSDGVAETQILQKLWKKYSLEKTMIMVWERYCNTSPKPEFFFIFFVYIFIHISANMSLFG